MIMRLAGFWADRRGNVAMMWGLMGVVLLGLIGITVDLTRAEMLRTRMQNAVDGAALVAERSAGLSLTARQEAAEAYFQAEMGDLAEGAAFSMEQIPNVGHRVEASMPMNMSLASLVSTEPWNIHAVSQAQQGGRNIEVAMVLDATGSMSGTPISDLRTAATDMVDILVSGSQTPFYSKVALIPYSMAVNAGSYAAQVRGSIQSARAITAAAWANGSARNITGITRANPAVVTSANHGLTNGAVVWIRSVSGMTQVNNRAFTVANVTTNTFQLQGVNSTGYNSYSSGGTFTRCLAANCNVVVTSNGHGFANGDNVYITGVNGMTQLNNASNTTWQVTGATTNTFALVGTGGSSYSTYTSGGSAYCTVQGCEYFRFTNASGSTRVYRVTTCVTERTGAQAYTETAPSTAPLGRNYQASVSSCPSANTFVPLTSDRNLLVSRISALQAAGSTAGHIGIAWGWYMLSPNFSYLWPSASQPGNYNDPNVLKIAVLMTDGQFNTMYCNDVLSRDSSAGSSSERINCDAPNGSSGAQARALCSAMKARGIIVYSVGFNIGADAEATDVMQDCASTASHFYAASNGVELREAFQQIADRIGELRLTQ